MVYNYIPNQISFGRRNRQNKRNGLQQPDTEEQYRILKSLTYILNVIEKFPPDLWDSTFFYRTLSLLSGPTIRNIVSWAVDNYGVKRCAHRYPGDFSVEINNRKDQLSNQPPIREISEMLSQLARTDSWLLHAYKKILLKEKEYYEGLSFSSSIFKKNLKKFQKLFNLSQVETDIIEFLWVGLQWEESDYLSESLDCFCFGQWKIIATALHISLGDFLSCVNGRLSNLHLIQTTYMGQTRISINQMSSVLLQSPDIKRGLFFRVEDKDEELSLESHTIDPKITKYVLDILRRGPESKDSSSIILEGSPGCGKTSFARGLAKELGLSPCFIQHGSIDPNLFSIREEENVKISVAASIEVAKSNDKNNNSLFIIDDADDILGTGAFFFFSGESRSRVWLHEILETPGLRLIWIVNDVRNIEDSVKRRFRFSVHFPPLKIEQRMSLWKSILKKNKADKFVDEDKIKSFVKYYNVSAGVIEQAVKTALDIKPRTKKTIPSRIEMSLGAYRTLETGREPKKKVEGSIKESFLIEAVNSSLPLISIVDDLQTFDKYLKNTEGVPDIKNRSLLFEGHPGCGKTEFAKYLAEVLNRPLLRKISSDLLDMYVGNTEKSINASYREAEALNAILFFDEADSLLYSRSMAGHSWEITQTNELLSQMEDFVGIQIFATNKMTSMDSASVRRFSHKIHFDFLKPDGCEIFYQKILAPMVKFPITENDIKRIRNIKRLSAGDFKIVKEQMYFKNSYQISHRLLISALEEESKIKKDQAGEKDFGF
jgi:transitional endoplasmic reticulum ATPase